MKPYESVYLKQNKVESKNRESSFNNKIKFSGQTYMGNGEAELTNRAFPGNWSDADLGDPYVSEWSEVAIDKNGNYVSIIYQFDLIKGKEPKPEYFDWDRNIVSVKPIT